MKKNSDFFAPVYQLCSQIPRGNISTYKHLANFLGISPRLVGQILKHNPFPSHLVPCHRVIQSNYFLGGFRGKEIALKRDKLEQEGIYFDKAGFLVNDSPKEKIIFKDFHE